METFFYRPCLNKAACFTSASTCFCCGLAFPSTHTCDEKGKQDWVLATTSAEELGTASLGPRTLTCSRGAVFGSPTIPAPQMGPGRCLLTALLLLALAPPPEASQYCGRLEYWNPDNKCCSSCLQRFGPPPCPELSSLASQPLSRLLDELEVLEELIVLLDPEPGPGGGMAHGTTRHLAARYGLPAAWSTFAYSLRPSRSPLRALIEMVVAREPSASLGQLGTHLAQLGRADALRVLSKLGSSGVCWA
ncbi:IGF-like family receptor 1 isoform X6 [Pan paniscus]|uniref:IGF-like family receptor 1 isoform X6 n=1 Tax=Pan paniscus TaxID=9597 RepID=UPI001560E61C|nr:IGF-like family receptor 1 isoform X5 [Pan paniscus]